MRHLHVKSVRNGQRLAIGQARIPYSRYQRWDLTSCLAVSRVKLTFTCKNINYNADVFSSISLRTRRNVDWIFFFFLCFLCGAKKTNRFWSCTKVEETNNVRKKNPPFYCLQSLFIPPVWSPNVPCRHTDRCCIWRSPFFYSGLVFFVCCFLP